MKRSDFNVAGFKFELAETVGCGTRYDHVLENGDRLIVVNAQSINWRPVKQTRWTAYRIVSGGGHWRPLKSQSGRKRYFGTPDVAAGQALKEWAVKN